MVSKVVFIVLMQLFLVRDLFQHMLVYLFVCYVFCFLFTQGDIPKHLVFFFGAWSFKLKIITLFINVTLDLYYQTKNCTKVKKRYVFQNAHCFKLSMLTFIPKH